MAAIRFYQLDYNYVGFEGDRDILYELRNRYSFYTSNYKYDKRYKMGYWDGKISMLNLKDMKMYAGLLTEVKDYLTSEGIQYEDETDLFPATKNLSIDDVNLFYQKIKGPFKPHESQAIAFQDCIASGRNIILAPTSNGKSYIIHGLNAYYKFLKKKVLIIINRSQLVLQLKQNFVDEYGSDQFYSTSTVYEDTESDVTITTWQTAINKDPSWFKQFDVLIGDEVHGFKAKSLINIINHCGHIAYRHGFTATLDNDSKTDAMTLEGMFGKPNQTITLRDQIDQGISSRPIVYAIMLEYPVAERKELIADIKRAKLEAVNSGRKNVDTIPFTTESKFIESHERRNKFLAKLASMQKGNTIIAFKNEDHGKAILESVEEVITNNVFFINGKVKKEKRVEIIETIKTLKQSTSVVSFGTTSTGINVPNLDNLIIASQVKSDITVPQLIGRMIRKTETKDKANVIDICDNLSHNGTKNDFYKHFEIRMKFYIKNGFEIHTKVIRL